MLPGLFYIRVLRMLAEFLIDFCTPLCALADANKQLNKQFLWIVNGHDHLFFVVTFMS